MTAFVLQSLLAPCRRAHTTAPQREGYWRGSEATLSWLAKLPSNFLLAALTKVLTGCPLCCVGARGFYVRISAFFLVMPLPAPSMSCMHRVCQGYPSVGRERAGGSEVGLLINHYSRRECEISIPLIWALLCPTSVANNPRSIQPPPDYPCCLLCYSDLRFFLLLILCPISNSL